MWSWKYRRPRFAGSWRANSTFLITSHLDKNVELHILIREGLGSAVRLGARSTQRLTNQLRLSLEPECLENPTATAREIPRDGADSIRDTQAVCGFRCWASKHTPLFHTIRTIVAIFLARVSRAISGRMPLVTNSA